MNDSTTDDWIPEQPAKKRLPRWVWMSCGCASLLAIAAALTLLIGGRMLLSRGQDPEIQWPRLEALMDVEGRPEHLELQFGGAYFGILDQFRLLDTRHQVVGTIYAASEPEAVLQLLEPDQPSRFGFGALEEPRLGTLLLQGREVRFLGFRAIGGESKLGEDPGPGMRLDLGLQSNKHVVAELRRPGEAPTEEDVSAFFDAFDLWGEE